MRNPKKVALIMDLLAELIEKRGIDASNDVVGRRLGNAHLELNHALWDMHEGTSSEDSVDEGIDENNDEPHGSRDTFVPKPKGPMTQDEWLKSMKEKEEIANAFEDYNAMQD